MTMTVQERKRIVKTKIILGIVFFIYLGTVVVVLYNHKMSDFGSATNYKYIYKFEDVQFNSSDLYSQEPTTRELQLKDIQERASAFLGLNNEPNEIP